MALIALEYANAQPTSWARIVADKYASFSRPGSSAAPRKQALPKARTSPGGAPLSNERAMSLW